MSLSNIGIASSPDIQALKKNIRYDALYYNIREQETKNIKKHLQKQKQVQEFKLINRRVSTELNEEINKAKDRKNYIRNILAHDYDKQIQEKKIHGLEEIKKERSYAKAAEENQKEYHERRSREMARILRAQRTLQAVNPEAQSLYRYETEQKRTKTLMSEPTYQQPKQLIQQAPFPSSSLPQQQQPHFHRQPLPSPNVQPNAPQQKLSQSYKDYLKQQIQRKKHQRQEQYRYRMEKQQQLVKKNTQLLEKEKEELREIQRKQREAFKKCLDQQVQEKAHFRKCF